MEFRRLQLPCTTPNPDFYGTQLFDVEYPRNARRDKDVVTTNIDRNLHTSYSIVEIQITLTDLE